MTYNLIIGVQTDSILLISKRASLQILHIDPRREIWFPNKYAEFQIGRMDSVSTLNFQITAHFKANIDAYPRGTRKVRNEIDTKRNETVRNEKKRNQTKRNETTLHFVSFRFVSFCLISFRFVRFLFRFALCRYPLLTVGLVKMKS